MYIVAVAHKCFNMGYNALYVVDVGTPVHLVNPLTVGNVFCRDDS